MTLNFDGELYLASLMVLLSFILIPGLLSGQHLRASLISGNRTRH